MVGEGYLGRDGLPAGQERKKQPPTKHMANMFKKMLARFTIRFSTPLANQQGMTYLFVMILVVIMGISLMGMTQQWSVIMKRDREAELAFRGTRIKEAIERFVADYEIQKATRPNRWPRTLEELTQKTPKRYLQAAYLDPITGEKFELIKQNDELHGVRSTSTDVPYNRSQFKGAQTYRAVRFEATGQAANCTPNPLNPLAPNCPPAPAPPTTGTPPAGGTPPTGSSSPTTPEAGSGTALENPPS